MKNVPVIDERQAAARVRSGDKLLVDGFGMTGTPVHLLHALAETDVKNLVFIGNNIGEPGLGGMTLTALMFGSSLEDVKRHTTANYRISDSLETAAVSH